MRHLRKLVGCVLALVMGLTMTTGAYAATVENKTDHSYNAYQVFSGTQEATGVPLGDAEWGNGVYGDALLAELQGDPRFNVGKNGANVFANCTTALDVANVLGTYDDNSDVAQAFANVTAKHLTEECTPIAKDATTVELATGYYLLVDQGTLGEHDAYNSALLQVTNKGKVTIAKKYDVPKVDKSVQDNGSDKWEEAADWEIGSNVPFQLVGTLPGNYADYETYKYVFHDTLSAGLKYNGDAKVYLQNGDDANTRTDITGSFTITTGENGALTISCDNLKAIITDVSTSSRIVVEYTAELLSTAEIGNPGNANNVYLEYSNNPNQTGEGTTSNTPEDKVLVFTYELDTTKVDGQHADKKLANAEFVLLNNDRTKVAKVDDGKFAGWAVVPAKGADGTITYPDGTTLTSDANGKFVVAGLDAGTYYLHETKAPAGYNLLKSDISLTISATLDKSEDNPALTALKLSVKKDNQGETTESDGDLASGIVSTNVENNSGVQLPETGGMGTTVFYAVGGILVLGAIVALVARRCMHSEDADRH